MAALEITKNNFESEVLKSEKPVLIDFWAAWCGPCKMLHPVIEELSDELKDAKVCKINVDDEPELASMFNVMSIPTLVVMKDGHVSAQSVGLKPKGEILKLMGC